MGSQRFLESMLFMMMLVMEFLLGLSQAYKFYVGGRDGWVTNPSENYNHWAERNRFQVNDTLFFKYKKGSDSVLIVNKDDYNSCNTKNPIKSLTDGDSTFIFDRSGPFFFVSGNADSCNNGQKLFIIVMAVRPKPQPFPSPPQHPPSPSSTPTYPPSEQPTSSPPAESPADEIPSDSFVPAQAPNGKSGSLGFRDGSLSVGLVLGASTVGVSLILGGLVGMV